jgi:hypothetical protein
MRSRSATLQEKEDHHGSEPHERQAERHGEGLATDAVHPSTLSKRRSYRFLKEMIDALNWAHRSAPRKSKSKEPAADELTGSPIVERGREGDFRSTSLSVG